MQSANALASPSAPGPIPASADPAGPATAPLPALCRAFVHNPYSFAGFDLVLEDPAVPSSPRSDSSCTSKPSSVGSRSALSDDVNSPSGCAFHPFSLNHVPESVLDIPARTESEISEDCVDHCQYSEPPAVSHKRAAAPPAGSLAYRAAPAQWRRYGTAVSCLEALKDLQAFTKQHPIPPPPPTLAVWVGPPSRAAPAAAAPAVSSPTRSIPACPTPQHAPGQSRLRSILQRLSAPVPPSTPSSPEAPWAPARVPVTRAQ
eukprot:EG_transcript_23107